MKRFAVAFVGHDSTRERIFLEIISAGNLEEAVGTFIRKSPRGENWILGAWKALEILDEESEGDHSAPGN